MKITLRKASALQNSINESIRGIDIADVIKLSEFQNPEIQITAESTKASRNLARKSALITALFAIRKVVGVTSAQVGIAEKLTAIACIDKFIQLFTEQAGRALHSDFEVLRFKAEKMRKSESDRSFYQEPLSSGIASQADIDSAKTALAALKKDKQRLQDEILELNIRTDIELSEEVVSILKVEDLI